MTFKEKIDKILRTNTIEINSVYGLEQYIGASPGAVNKYYKKNTAPGRGTIKKILEGLSINPEWWDTGNGDIYLEKGTDGDNQPAIIQKIEELLKSRDDDRMKYIRLLEKNNEKLEQDVEMYKSLATRGKK